VISMFRILDVFISFFALLLLWPILVLLTVIGLFDTGSPIFFQQRVGRLKRPFTLIKFRTMDVSTKSVATHLASSSSVTKYGAFLRKTKLDELPQLVNVLKGDMSLVGPRPNLFNQEELIDCRENKGVYEVRPGITGKAQILNIDMSQPQKLAEVDAEMINSLNLRLYFYYILKTALGKGSGDKIKS